MRVLYLNHTGQMSGAERALLDLLECLPPGLQASLACPPEGGLAAAARQLGIQVFRLPEIRLSLRLHPLETGAGLMETARAALGLRRLTRQQGAELVHANSLRAGLVATLASRLGGPPAVVHLHDCLPRGGAAELARRVIAGSAAMVLANSRYTGRAFAGEGRSRIPMRVVHNSVDAARFRPTVISRERARERLGLPASAQVLGLVAQLTPWKAQDDAIEMLAELRSRWPQARLVLVGSAKFRGDRSRYDNEEYERRLRQRATRLALADAVSFLGERTDLPQVLKAFDVFVMPSWEEPFGIALLEAMAMELPVLATEVGGPPEIITDGVDGLLLPPRRPRQWADALDRLLASPQLRAGLGLRARVRVVAAFSRRHYVEGMISAYSQVLGRWPAAA